MYVLLKVFSPRAMSCRRLPLLCGKTRWLVIAAIGTLCVFLGVAAYLALRFTPPDARLEGDCPYLGEFSRPELPNPFFRLTCCGITSATCVLLRSWWCSGWCKICLKVWRRLSSTENEYSMWWCLLNRMLTARPQVELHITILNASTIWKTSPPFHDRSPAQILVYWRPVLLYTFRWENYQKH